MAVAPLYYRVTAIVGLLDVVAPRYYNIYSIQHVFDVYVFNECNEEQHVSHSY